MTEQVYLTLKCSITALNQSASEQHLIKMSVNSFKFGHKNRGNIYFTMIPLSYRIIRLLLFDLVLTSSCVMSSFTVSGPCNY